MHAPSEPFVSLNDQRAITHQVFVTMADIELTPCDPPIGVEPLSIASVVDYGHQAENSLVVECSPNLAFWFTGKLMSIPAPSTFNDDVKDSMKELVNMIGGNIKGLMPEQMHLSMPRIVDEAEHPLYLANARCTSRLHFMAGKEHCCISLFHISH
jgi:CheY-specific phosphatase CheX